MKKGRKMRPYPRYGAKDGTRLGSPKAPASQRSCSPARRRPSTGRSLPASRPLRLQVPSFFFTKKGSPSGSLLVRRTGLEPVRLPTRPSNVRVCQFRHHRISNALRLGAEGRTRTDTPSRAPDFESGASAISPLRRTKRTSLPIIAYLSLFDKRFTAKIRKNRGAQKPARRLRRSASRPAG